MLTSKKRSKSDLLKKIFVSLFSKGKLSLTGLVLYVITYYLIIVLVKQQINVVYCCFGIVFASLAFNLVWYYHRQGNKESCPPTGVRELRTDNPIVIFSLMYGFVASFAITEALRTFAESIKSPLDKYHIVIKINTSFSLILHDFYEAFRKLFMLIGNDLFNLIGFLSVALPFIHAGFVFLSTMTAELIFLKQDKPINVFVIFVLSFIQAIFIL